MESIQSKLTRKYDGSAEGRNRQKTRLLSILKRTTDNLKINSSLRFPNDLVLGSILMNTINGHFWQHTLFPVL